MIRKVLLASASALAMGPARAGALDATVDSLDAIPEALHAEYVQQGDKYVLQVNGMKPESEFQRVQGALTKERNDHNGLKTRVALLGDRKIEDVVPLLDRIPELEALAEGKIDDEKINSIVEGRVRTKLAPVERERDTYKAKVGELEGTVQSYTAKEKKRLIRDKVREAANEAKIQPYALDDALLLGETLFEVREDDGEVVVREGVGFTQGIAPSVLFSDLKSKRPHWWGDTIGGGAGGQRGAGGSGANPFSKAGWNMTEQGKIMEADAAKAEQLAKVAGHRDAANARKADAK